MAADEDVAVALAWKAYAEACCEHDPVHGRCAAAELARLLPDQRQPDDPVLSHPA